LPRSTEKSAWFSLLRIIPAFTAADVETVRELFREYERSLGVDLDYQGFEEELATLPGRYAPPRGRLLIAWDGDEVGGCVALRSFGDDLCEMKRLYLRPSSRGKGVGRALAMRAIDEARAIGYRAMRLDTLPTMSEARALYESLDFRRIPPYYPSPVPGTLYMERTL
jgi:putative acetyltransferase